MVLNLNAANSYNRSRDYSSALVRVIRREVGSQESGSLGNQTAVAIHVWQGHQRGPRIAADGMFGPMSLGKLIQSLEAAGRSEEVELARRFPHHDFRASSGTEEPILEFRALRVRPITLERSGVGWICKGKFRVIIRFNPEIDASRYEYRQFIKGKATTQSGSFTSTVPRMDTWVGSGTVHDAKNAFRVPGGLSPGVFKEDGFVKRSGAVERYGYRANPGTTETTTIPEDRYLPSQANGRTYRCTDSPGLENTLRREHGLKISQRFMFKGQVIDTARGNRVIATRHWKIEGDRIVTV